MDRAIARIAAYSDSQVYLLNWIVGGECRCLTGNDSRGGWEGCKEMYEKVWECCMSEDKVQQMASHPGVEYLRELLESNPPHPRRDEFIPWLVEPFHSELEHGVDQLPIRSSVMLVVITDGKILSRGRAWNQFTNMDAVVASGPRVSLGCLTVAVKPCTTSSASRRITLPYWKCLRLSCGFATSAVRQRAIRAPSFGSSSCCSTMRRS